MSPESIESNEVPNIGAIGNRINQLVALPGGGWWTCRWMDSLGGEIADYEDGCRLFLGVNGNTRIGDDLSGLCFPGEEGEVADCVKKAVEALEAFGFVYSGSAWKGERVFVQKS